MGAGGCLGSGFRLQGLRFGVFDKGLDRVWSFEVFFFFGGGGGGGGGAKSCLSHVTRDTRVRLSGVTQAASQMLCFKNIKNRYVYT